MFVVCSFSILVSCLLFSTYEPSFNIQPNTLVLEGWFLDFFPKRFAKNFEESTRQEAKSATEFSNNEPRLFLSGNKNLSIVLVPLPIFFLNVLGF